MDKKLQKELNEAVAFIKSKSSLKPKICIVLGSGLGDYANNLKLYSVISTSDIPHYPKSTVIGHKGKIIFGVLPDKKNNFRIPVIIYQGRVHYYETGNLKTTLFPILIANKLGIKYLLLTNAAGGVNRNFHPGDLMLIKDHINLTFENTNKFVQKITQNSKPIYDFELIKLILKTTEINRIPLREGIYVGVKGPSYETAAEIEMIRRIGGDAVGMSTVNEATLASMLGIRVAGLSCITNYATGVTDTKLFHDEVTMVANMVKTRFSNLISEILFSIDKLP